MASNYIYINSDFDTIFKPLGEYTPRAAINYKVGTQDLANRYCPTANLGPGLNDITGQALSFRISGPTDINTLFRSIACPNVSLIGPASVTAGSFNGETWAFGTASVVTGVRFQVVDHGAGNWSSVADTTYTGTTTWTDPFANPSIANTPGTYVFFFQAMNSDHFVGDARMTVVVN